jgi:beta-glucosidase
MFWFGHGLGYTTWRYENVSAPRRIRSGGLVIVDVTVRNTGHRAGREVVQVYLSRPDSAVERPVRWLAGHTAVRAEPGEAATVSVTLSPRAVQHWSVSEHGWRTEPGEFTVLAGRSAGDLPLSTTLAVD